MRLSFEYKGRKISYDLLYKKTAAINIRIKEDGQVDVTAPLGTSVQTVADKVKGNAPWIISEVDKIYYNKTKDNLLEHYTYLGKTYGVQVVINNEREKIDVKLIRGKFIIETYTNDEKKLKEALLLWYRNKVYAKIRERLKVYEKLFEYVPSEIETRYDKSFLLKVQGSKMLVSLLTGILPINTIDYVVVRVLCELNDADNKEKSIKRLKEILPEYKKEEEWLDKNKAQLIL